MDQASWAQNPVVTVTRELPETYTPGAKVTATLNVTVSGGPRVVLCLWEQAPWQLDSVEDGTPPPSDSDDDGYIYWELYSVQDSYTLQYSMIVPFDANQDVFFGGNAVLFTTIDGDNVGTTTTGDYKIKSPDGGVVAADRLISKDYYQNVADQVDVWVQLTTPDGQAKPRTLTVEEKYDAKVFQLKEGGLISYSQFVTTKVEGDWGYLTWYFENYKNTQIKRRFYVISASRFFG